MELKDLIIARAMQKVASRMEKEAGIFDGVNNLYNQKVQAQIDRGLNALANQPVSMPWALPAKGIRWFRKNIGSKNPLKLIDNMQQSFYDTPYKQNMMKATVGPAPLHVGGEMGMMHNKNIGAQ